MFHIFGKIAVSSLTLPHLLLISLTSLFKSWNFLLHAFASLDKQNLRSGLTAQATMVFAWSALYFTARSLTVASIAKNKRWLALRAEERFVYCKVGRSTLSVIGSWTFWSFAKADRNFCPSNFPTIYNTCLRTLLSGLPLTSHYPVALILIYFYFT